MNADTLNKTHLRAIQYWFEDGIVEIAVGVLFLLLAGYFYVDATQPDSLLANLLGGLFVLLLVSGWYLVGWIIKLLKERLTYPRTGYVAFRRDKNSQKPVRLALALSVGALMAAMFATLALNPPLGLNFMPLGSGLVMALVFGLIGYRTALPRFYLLAAFGLVLGAGLGLSQIGNGLGMTAIYALMALALIGTGLVILSRYLRQNPAPAEASDGQ
ncbi:MAG: hypothetical protein EHM81_03975 [Chloroflexi bacterium]|nr:MAG: hypothetical protein EHM81_03975 [Chloroflexota bacterium]